MERGMIKTVIVDRGFGFISPADGHGGDLFFHMRQLAGGLVFGEDLKGREVEFIGELDPKTNKPRAKLVQPVGGAQ